MQLLNWLYRALNFHQVFLPPAGKYRQVFTNGLQDEIYFSIPTPFHLYHLSCYENELSIMRR